MNATAALLYFLSGATGLCYEVLWARMLSAQFGASTFGIAATVTAFLLGLGISMGLYGKDLFLPHLIFAGLSITLAIAHAIVGLVWFRPHL